MGAKKRSSAWRYFTTEGEQPKRARCAFCPDTISFASGSLSNLLRHLRNKHPSLELDFSERPEPQEAPTENNQEESSVNTPPPRYRSPTRKIHRIGSSSQSYSRELLRVQIEHNRLLIQHEKNSEERRKEEHDMKMREYELKMDIMREKHEKELERAAEKHRSEMDRLTYNIEVVEDPLNNSVLPDNGPQALRNKSFNVFRL